MHEPRIYQHSGEFTLIGKYTKSLHPAPKRVHLKHFSNAVFTLFMIIHTPTVALGLRADDLVELRAIKGQESARRTLKVGTRIADAGAYYTWLLVCQRFGSRLL
jgi:hypothetical protein